MHNIKLIRKDPEFFSKKLLDRNLTIDSKKILDLDKKNRDLIQNKEMLEQEKKKISQGKDKSQFKKSKILSEKITDLDNKHSKVKKEIDNILGSLPNIALEDVPIGKDEKNNKEIKKVGEIKKFDFKTLSHYEIGKKLNMLDFETSSKTSGSRFVFIKSKLAMLERAISNYMLDLHTKEYGYTEISPPLIVSDSTMFGTVQ